MWDKIKLAEKADVRLVHENEHRIYGDETERVKDLMETVLEQADIRNFGAVYDPANYVHGGFEGTVADLRKQFRFLGETGCYYFLYVVKEEVPDYDSWCASRGVVHAPAHVS